MLDYVTDITIAYPGTITQNEIDIIKGNFPSEIHFLVNKYPNSEIPSHQDDLENWCKEKWQQKEEVLKNFYEKKSFDSNNLVTSNESLVSSLFLYAWVFWSLFQIGSVYIVWCYPLSRIYVIGCTIFYVCISKFTPGFNLLIASAFNIP